MSWKKMKGNFNEMFKPSKKKNIVLLILLLLTISFFLIGDACEGFSMLRSYFGKTIECSTYHCIGTFHQCKEDFYVYLLILVILILLIPGILSYSILQLFDVASPPVFFILTWILFLIFYYFVISLIFYLFRKYRKRKVFKISKKGLVILFLFLLGINLTHSLSDSNASNNVLSETVNITATNNLNLLIRPIQKIGETFNFNDYEENVKDQIDFLNRTSPLADDDLTYTVTTTPLSTFPAYVPALIHFGILTALQGNLSAYNRFVGVYNPTFLSQAGFHLEKAGFLNRFVLFKDNRRISTAHELGHTYGLCDEFIEPSEYDFIEQDANRTVANGGCPNHDLNEDGLLDSDVFIYFV